MPKHTNVRQQMTDDDDDDDEAERNKAQGREEQGGGEGEGNQKFGNCKNERKKGLAKCQDLPAVGFFFLCGTSQN